MMFLVNLAAAKQKIESEPLPGLKLTWKSIGQHNETIAAINHIEAS
jgi:hypothetical protein